MRAGEARNGLRAALDELCRSAGARGIDLSPEQRARFEIFITTLLLWRSRLSLTAAATPLVIVQSHILDSLSLAAFIKAGQRVADLGSGPGFPGIPLAIVRPRATFVLVESKRKKASFLREVVRQAGLINATVTEERAESLDGSGAYDVVVSRAVWPVSEFLKVSQVLLPAGGLAVAMKGPRGVAESGSTDEGFSRDQTLQYRLPDDSERVLLVYRKL